MPKILNIPVDIKTAISDCLDDLITLMGQTIVLQYPPKKGFCPNCLFSGIDNRSTNRYKSGGPMPFQVGTCPLCNGTGYRDEAQSEAIQVLVAWTPKNFFIQPTNIALPDCDIQTKGYVSDVPKIMRCVEMKVMGLDGYVHQRFTRTGEPNDINNIVQGRFAVTKWKRLG